MAGLQDDGQSGNLGREAAEELGANPVLGNNKKGEVWRKTARCGNLDREAAEAVRSYSCTGEYQEMGGLEDDGQIWESGPGGGRGG